MQKGTNWWDPIFSGELEVGLNKERLEDLEQEAFLYHEAASSEVESHA